MGRRLFGIVKDDKSGRFADGTHIVTSTLKKVNTLKGAAQAVVDRYNSWDKQAGKPEHYDVVTYQVTEIQTEENK